MRARWARRASSSFPSRARRVARVTWVGKTFDVTLMTPLAPTAIIGSVSASSPLEDREAQIAHRLRQLLRAQDVAGRLLHAHDVRRLGADALESVGQEVDACTSGDVVENDGQTDASRDLHEVTEEARGGGLVVVGDDHHDGVGAGALGVLRQADGLAGGVRPGAGHHLGALVGALHGALDDLDVLLVREGRTLAGGPARDEARDPRRDLGVDEGVEGLPNPRGWLGASRKGVTSAV